MTDKTPTGEQRVTTTGPDAEGRIDVYLDGRWIGCHSRPEFVNPQESTQG